MVWESFDGTARELDLGRAPGSREPGGAHARGARRRARRPRRGRAAADARDGGGLLRRLEARRDPALDVGALRRRGDSPPARRLERNAARHRRRERAPLRPRLGARRARPRRDTLADAPTELRRRATRRPTIRRSSTTRPGTTGLAKGDRARAPLPARARGVRLLPRGARTASASTAWANGPGRPASRRCSGRGGSAPSSASTGARAGFDPHKQLDFLSRHEVTNVFTTPTAMRAMMAIEDAGTRYPQQFRRVCSAGEPLNPEAIRWFREQYGVTVLDYYGLTESYPLVANYPFMEVREGSMGKPMPGWDVADPRRGRAARRARASAARSACARARTRTIRSATGTTRRRARRPSAASGSTRRTPRARTRTATIWYEGRADDVIIAAGYRIGPFEVESACLEHPAVREAAAVASPDELRGNVVKAFIVLADGHEPSRRARRRDQVVRPRAPLRLRLPAADRVRHRPAEDAHRQDPPHRAARARARVASVLLAGST